MKYNLGNWILRIATVTGIVSNDTCTGGFDRRWFIYNKEWEYYTRLSRGEGTFTRFSHSSTNSANQVQLLALLCGTLYPAPFPSRPQGISYTLFSTKRIQGATSCNFHEIWYLNFFWSKVCRETSGFIKNLTRITSILHEDVYTFMTISRLLVLRMSSVSNKLCRENQKHILCLVIFFSSENHAVYETMWKTMLEPERPQKTI